MHMATIRTESTHRSQPFSAATATGTTTWQQIW